MNKREFLPQVARMLKDKQGTNITSHVNRDSYRMPLKVTLLKPFNINQSIYSRNKVTIEIDKNVVTIKEFVGAFEKQKIVTDWNKSFTPNMVVLSVEKALSMVR